MSIFFAVNCSIVILLPRAIFNLIKSEDNSAPEFRGFNIAPGRSDNYKPVIGSSPLQIVVLIYSALCWALIIFAIVKCSKSKVRLKALWIIGIIIQHGVTLAKTASSVNYSIHFFYIGISQLVMSKGGYLSLTLVFPIVAVIFLLLKKLLIKNHQTRISDIEQQEEELSRLSIERLNADEPRNSEILGTNDTPDETNKGSLP